MSAIEVLAANRVVERTTIPDELSRLPAVLQADTELGALDIRLRLHSVEGQGLPRPLRAERQDLRLAAAARKCTITEETCRSWELRDPWSALFTFAGDAVKSDLWREPGDLLTRLRNQASRMGSRLQDVFGLDGEWRLEDYCSLQATIWACQAVGVFGPESVGARTEDEAIAAIVKRYDPPRAETYGVSF